MYLLRLISCVIHARLGGRVSRDMAIQAAVNWARQGRWRVPQRKRRPVATAAIYAAEDTE